MFRKLGALFKSRRARSLEAEVAELRVAVAGLLAAGRNPDGAAGEIGDIDAVLLHAATARVEIDRLDGLYEGAMVRIAALESRLQELEASVRPVDRH